MLKSEPVECPICIDGFVDPRALPCGHCYCGPPRTCLKAVKTETGGALCSVCKREFDLNVNELGPLFGIRDLFLGPSTSKMSSKNDKHAYCSEHYGNVILFWCKSCTEKACPKCFDLRHQSHHLTSYRCYLHEVAKPLLEEVKPLYHDKEQNLNNIVQDFEGYSKFFADQQEAVNFRKALFKCDLKKLQDFGEKWQQLENFVKNMDYDVSLSLVEAFVEKPFQDLVGLEVQEPNLGEPNALGVSFATEVVYSTKKHPPIDPVVIKNKYFSVEVLFYSRSRKSFTTAATMTPEDHSIIHARFNGSQSIQIKGKNRIVAVRDVIFSGVCERDNFPLFQETEVHVEKNLKKMRVKNITARGTFVFSLSFQIDIYVNIQ